MEKIVSLKYDFVFREVFSREGVLKSFISAVTGIAPERIRSARLVSPFLGKRYWGQKLGILDVAVILNDNVRMDIELQIRPQKDWIRRSLFYLAKMYTEDLKTGQRYERLRKCVAISVLDFNLIPGEECHSVYTLRDRSGGQLTDLFEIHIIELGKKPTGDTALGEWVQLFNAGTREEMDMIKTENPGILEAMEVIRTMNLGKLLRMGYEARLKAKRDRWAEDDYVRDLGKVEGKTDAILKILGTKGEIPGKLRARITAQTDGEVLDRWVLAAAEAADLETFLEKIDARRQ